MVKRLFVEKKSGFDVEAKGLLEDIKTNLHIQTIENIRVINRYDVDGIDEQVLANAKMTVFAEPPIDFAYDENFPVADDEVYFGVELLAGQYDQRADSAEMCIKLIHPDAEPIVRFAKMIVIKGNISENELCRIKEYCINPVDSQEALVEKPESLEIISSEPEDVEIIDGFIEMTKADFKNFIKSRGFAMTEDDLAVIHRYFKYEENRNPTITELKVIDTYWSDHCRHTTFNTEITNIEFDSTPYGREVEDAYLEYQGLRDKVYGEDTDRAETLMDIAVIGAKYLKKIGKLDDLDESEEINACSIKVKADVDGREEDWLVMFKNETHNHPTEIEPFGGAATCLGGAIRDPLSGRAYVYQAMRVTGSGDPRTPIDETLEGKLPQIKITREAAAGYSSYGNQIGLATGLVDEIYDKNYIAKRMEVGAVIGATPADHVVRKRPEPSDLVILVGGKTGRDGCGGATGSSKEHTKDSMQEAGAEVQKGNPPVERNIQRLFRRKEAATLIKKCNDFGAGGVSVAIGELADGLDIYLDNIQKKYNGLDGTELAISESQERMAVVIDEENEALFKELARQENLEATTVATVTDDNRVTMYWREKKILDISRTFLDTNGAIQKTEIFVTDNNLDKNLFELSDYEQALTNLNCCSKKGLIERFDSTIGGNTVLMPLGGKYQLSPSIGMAAKLPVVKGETNTASLMTYGYDPDLAKVSPYRAAMYAVIDSVTKIVAMGGRADKVRLSFQEYFEKLTDDASWGKPAAALLGALKAQKELEIPAIGGKDSMSGTFMDIKVPPALISFAVDTVDARNIISTELKSTDSTLILVKAKVTEKGFDFDSYKENMSKLAQLIRDKKILSANTVGKGGIFISLVKMAVGNKIGICADNVDKDILLSASYGSLLLEVENKYCQEILDLLGGKAIGQTNNSKSIEVKNVDKEFSMDIDNIIEIWTKPLEEVFPSKPSDDSLFNDEKVEKISYFDRNNIKPREKVLEPKVIIPCFPGTNCELDSARAFERAGAKAEIHIIRNLDSKELVDSIDELASKIREANILMIPGGFSGGDEPDGSAKFITAVFRNPKIKEAVEYLLDEKDGLIIGICNGFQALIKLGLVPYGKIVDIDENSPTLSYNKIGRHVSGLVRTRIASVKSPWLSNVNVGDVFNIAVSHGEGRFICSEKLLEQLKENGQIITQYVNQEGLPTMNMEDNPNFSILSVEGITSPDGRVLGKMGHSERISESSYKNIEGNQDMKLFESAVAYFQK